MIRRSFCKITITIGISVLPTSILFAADRDKPAGALPGFHGEITDLKVVPNSQPTDVTAEKPTEPDMDLVGMARWSLRALKHNPRPHMNHECRFGMSLLHYPPGPHWDAHDPITAGDTENRIDWEFGYMKDMCGDCSADAIAAGVRKRIAGHLRDDGLCWVPTNAFGRLPGLWANHWTTCKYMISLAEDYRREQNPKKREKIRQTCRKMFEALKARADWVDGRAYYAGGNSCWNDKMWAITDATPYNPAMLLEGVVTYYEVFKDEEALKFAVAFAEGEMAKDQWNNWIMKDPSKLLPEQKEHMKLTSSMMIVWPTAPGNANLSVRPDGSFDHHSHMRGHSGWGMAHLASITKEPRLTAWCKRLLDFYLVRGTDYGWIPESMTYPRRSETCAVADVISMATYTAKCGYPEYWDVVERFTRNYIREAQFFLTPEYKDLYRRIHPGDAGKKGLEMAKDYEGGFLGAIGLSDCCYAPNTMDMMGCCMPEGMRSIYTAWLNTVRKEKDGVYVNLSFDRDAPQAKVTSFLPREGKIRVEAKTADDYFVRLSEWVPKDKVAVYRNGKPVTLAWKGPYTKFAKVVPGDVLTVTYPLLSFVQKQKVSNTKGEPDREMTVTWLGNTVMKLEPRGGHLPLYQNAPRPLPPLPKEDSR